MRTLSNTDYIDAEDQGDTYPEAPMGPGPDPGATEIEQLLLGLQGNSGRAVPAGMDRQEFIQELLRRMSPTRTNP